MKKTKGEPKPRSYVESVAFVVNDRPTAVYGVGLQKMTEGFVKYFSSTFWEHQLNLLKGVPRNSVTHDHVSLARFALAHAEEHLFSLIFAFLQAPHCPDLWLYRYKHEDLIDLVGSVKTSRKIQNCFRLETLTWDNLARVLWPGLEEKRYLQTSLMLERLADLFTSDFGREEFNGMKHGMRLSFGGTHFSFSPGGSPDKLPDPESFVSLGGSEYGCRFWAFEKLAGTKGHFRAKLRMANWDIDEIIFYLSHTTLLICNMGTAFRSFAKIPGESSFKFYNAEDAYDRDPRKVTGMVVGELITEFELGESDLVNFDCLNGKYT